ncbi:ribonuclease Z [Petrimonas sulfuriphila]|uniref:ribonuclease Z n=1 Tax=Petrimonas sulfuriphila TaxID=285070 RepID=UPI003EB85816
MTRFEITILGCGSAMPTTLHNPSSQLVNVNEKLFMIDCGEGTQLQLRKYKTRINKLHSIFISHLHGDHVFGLPGLLATLSLLGRTGDLNIYAHKDMELFLDSFIKHFGNQFPYKINLTPLDPYQHQLIFENNSIRVFSFPLKHRIPTSGFLFEEKDRPRHIKREMIDFYNIPVCKINEIKKGGDYLTDDGKWIKNEILTTPAIPPRTYAYCSDTAYSPEIIPYIQHSDVLYHEATFAEAENLRAQETYHSTARQAAEIARSANVRKLIIGHFSSRYHELGELLDEAQAVFPETELADEGMTINL